MKPLLPDAEIDCLRSLLKAAAELDVPIIAVGATARWLVFNLPNGIPLHRTAGLVCRLLGDQHLGDVDRPVLVHCRRSLAACSRRCAKRLAQFERRFMK